MSARRYLYTDRRYADVVDPAIEKMPTLDDQVRFALAVGLELNIVAMKDEKDGVISSNGVVSFVPDGVDYDSMPALFQTAREDNEFRTKLFDAFNRGLRNVERRHWNGVLDSAVNKARRRANLAPNAAASTFWREAAHVVVQHRQRGQYTVRG
jgi:hypothetical protein